LATQTGTTGYCYYSTRNFKLELDLNPSFGNVPLAKEFLANLTNQKFAYPKNRKPISQASFFALANGFSGFHHENGPCGFVLIRK
jgi:hypothetical protein